MDKQKLSWDHDIYNRPKVTNMGSGIGHKVDYNGVA